MDDSFFPAYAGPWRSWIELDDPLPVQPSWDSPPWFARPAVVAASVELGRSASTVVLIEGIRAYSEGLVLRLTVRIREAPAESRRRLFQQLGVSHGRGQLQLALPVGGLRWGMEFADGGQVTSLDDRSPYDDLPAGTNPREWTPTRPVMRGLGRPDSFGATWARDIWLWPLPPPGPLRVVCAWPDRDIAETSTTLDTESLREAAGRATPEWPTEE